MKPFLHDFQNPGGRPSGIDLPECGRLSVGADTEGGKKPPKALDHFRVYNADTIVKASFLRVYGPSPSELVVTFTSSNPDEVCRTRYTLRCGKVKYAYGDGQTFQYWKVNDWNDPARKGHMEQIQVSSEAERDKLMARLEEEAGRVAQAKGVRASKWGMELRLKVWLPEVQAVGSWVFTTGGEATSVKKISSIFKMVLMAAGTVQFLPFKLRVKLHKGDTMERKQYPIVELVPPSAAAIEAAGNYGLALYEQVFGKGGGMRMLSDEEIIDAGRQLSEGTGLRVNVAPVSEEIPDPDPVTMAKAEVHMEAGMANPPVDLGSNPQHRELTEGSLAYFLQAFRTVSGWNNVVELWDRGGSYHSMRPFQLHYLLASVRNAPTKELLDKLVKGWPNFHDSEEFKQAVKTKRNEKGWTNGAG